MINDQWTTPALRKKCRIRSYSGPYFPAFGLNTDQNNSEYGHFLGSAEYSSDNPESRNKRINKLIKTDKMNINSKKLYEDNKNENQERIQKTVSPSAYNKTEQQKNPTLKQKIKPTYSGAVSNKPKNIFILSDSMLKTLRMREFNKHLEERIAQFKALPGSKAQQLHHHSTSILQDHKYDGAFIRVGINDLINIQMTIKIQRKKRGM